MKTVFKEMVGGEACCGGKHIPVLRGLTLEEKRQGERSGVRGKEMHAKRV